MSWGADPASQKARPTYCPHAIHAAVVQSLSKKVDQNWTIPSLEATLYKLSQLFWEDALKSLQALSKEFTLLKSSLYQYIQICHAIRAQVQLTILQFSQLPLLDRVVTSATSRRGPLINIYASLLSLLWDPLPCLVYWHGSEMWEIWSRKPGGMPWRHCCLYPLTQLFILHRAYQTLVKRFTHKVDSKRYPHPHALEMPQGSQVL